MSHSKSIKLGLMLHGAGGHMNSWRHEKRLRMPVSISPISVI